MVATVLALDADDSAGKVAQWRQLVDLVVQARGSLSEAVREVVLARVARLRAQVPVEQRRLAAAQLAARATAVDGVALFGVDEPIVAAPVLAAARLSAEDWRALIPKIPAASRVLLRNRRDLPHGAIVALNSYGHSDFGLPGTGNAADPGAQIRDLVARIEAFRQGHASAAALPPLDTAADHFAFETNADGAIDWVVGAAREALIGIAVGEAAEAGGYGVDGQAAGAFRRRAPFRDARLSVAGSGPASGIWLMSASPVFNPRDGRFAGYHGSARRPRADEVAGPVARFAGTTLPADSLRQLIHELRTPLNAILGFAEMIDQQLLGPAASAYRGRAHEIVGDGRRLLEMVDDLDHAARPPTVSRHDDVVDARAALARACGQFDAIQEERGIVLAVTAHDTAIDVAGVGAPVLDRIMARLISASLGLAARGETITVALTPAPSPVLTVARPVALAGIEDARLLDPAFDPDTPYPDAPLLGLGFTLRLIDNLARGAGGRFAIRPDAFVVTFPAAAILADLPADASGE
jgi:signal transduction histidine kinase